VSRQVEHIAAYIGFRWRTILAVINAMVQAHASIMSYRDIFWLPGIVVLIVSPAILVLPSGSKGIAFSH
jgi:hypothetical protein